MRACRGGHSGTVTVEKVHKMARIQEHDEILRAITRNMTTEREVKILQMLEIVSDGET